MNSLSFTGRGVEILKVINPRAQDFLVMGVVHIGRVVYKQLFISGKHCFLSACMDFEAIMLFTQQVFRLQYRVQIIASHFANCEVNFYYCHRNVSHSMKNTKQFFRFRMNLIKRYKE